MLTPRQREVMDVIRGYRAEHGLSPTIQEIADRIGLSKSATGEHVNALVEKGFLERGAPRKFRTLEPVDEELIVKADAIKALEKVVARKKPTDQVGRLGSAVVKAITDLPGVSVAKITRRKKAK